MDARVLNGIKHNINVGTNINIFISSKPFKYLKEVNWFKYINL